MGQLTEDQDRKVQQMRERLAGMDNAAFSASVGAMGVANTVGLLFESMTDEARTATFAVLAEMYPEAFKG